MSYRICGILRAAIVISLTFLAAAVSAHEPSKSYLNLTLQAGALTGRWEIPLRDLTAVTKIGPPYQRAIAYAFAHLKISIDGQSIAPVLANTEPVVETLSDGDYLAVTFDCGRFATSKTLGLTFTLFFETNSLHRGLVRIEADGKVQVASFSPERQEQQFQLGAASQGHEFLVFLREGVWHIWTGYDHILFLLALLLPSVLQRDAGHWRAVSSLRPAFLNVLKIVTAFTVAHSLTLTIATLGLVKLPSRLTESAIALSVALAAANNLWPVVRDRGWMVAFGFGLVHGFGFATALTDLGLDRGGLALTLVGFNVGVEIGQLAIVSVFVPVAFALRRTAFYQGLLRFGSACIVLVAAAWCVERIADVEFMPF